MNIHQKEQIDNLAFKLINEISSNSIHIKGICTLEIVKETALSMYERAAQMEKMEI